jgi:hypothetical protein
MLVVASRKCDKNNKIYHRWGCIYARRIKPHNRKGMSVEVAERKHYHSCKYCAGLRGDVNVHKAAFASWSEKRNMQFQYHKPSDTLYIQTEVGCWKVFLKKELGEYLLYHRNTYSAGMDFNEAIHGDFHRQSDVKATESMEMLVEYIAAHDRAKVIIMDNYRKLPKSTKQQKKYYKAAERRDKKQAMRRLDSIFAALEQSQAGMKRYSFC